MPSSKSATKQKSKAIEPDWQWSFEAIGTQWWIGIYQASLNDIANLKAKIDFVIEDFDKTYSRFRDDSIVTAMSQKAGEYVLPANAALLFKLYRALYDATDMHVTPLIGQMLSDAGYDAHYSLQPKAALQISPKWEDVVTVNGNTLTVTQPILLDFGAVGKGYLVDLVAELLKSEGITQFCIDAGGDMFTSVALTIGLENPDDPTEAIGVAKLHNQALCGSAPNRRAWGKYHHIMDPKSGSSTSNIKAVWVMAETTALADGLTTALFFTDAAVLQKSFKFDYAVVYADGSLRHSSGFLAEFFS